MATSASHFIAVVINSDPKDNSKFVVPAQVRNVNILLLLHASTDVFDDLIKSNEMSRVELKGSDELN